MKEEGQLGHHGNQEREDGGLTHGGSHEGGETRSASESILKVKANGVAHESGVGSCKGKKSLGENSNIFT